MLGSPAEHNEYYKLELSGAWEPPDSLCLGKGGNKEEPNIVFLMETKVDKNEWIDKVKERCKLKHGVFVPSNGNSGSLALFWKDGVTLDVQSYAYDHIDAWIDGGSSIGWWHLTGFYGNLETDRRPESWAKLKFLKNSSSLPWLVIGDFNEIIGLSEKEGGRIRPKDKWSCSWR